MRKFLFTSLLFLFPSWLLADTLSLTPPDTDLSMSYLATIFGVVDNVLHGTGSQILGTMFGAFNSIILVMASTVLSYVLFTSILNTSHEGEFLGKKWSSIWVPLRTVMGVGLLLPKATGYSMIQIFVLWVVVQGVGAADEVWNVALNYINRNGTIIEPIQSLAPKPGASGSNPNNTFLISKAGSILKSEVCMLVLENALKRQKMISSTEAVRGLTPVPNFLNLLSVTGKNSVGSNTNLPIDYSKDRGGFITFPSRQGLVNTPYAEYIGACGNVSWDFIGKSDNAEVYNPAQLTANDSASIATRQMTLDLAPLAENIANKLVPPTPKNPVFTSTLSPNDPIFTPNVLVHTGEDYFGIVKPALRTLADDASKKYKGFINKAKTNGWILAGSYYYNMARLNQSIRSNNSTTAMTDKILPFFNPIYQKGSLHEINDNDVLTSLESNLPADNGVIDSYVASEMTRAASSNNPDESDPSLPEHPANVNAIGKVVSAILDTIFPRVQDFEKKLADGINNKNMDPIVAIASVGNGLVSMVEQVWISLLAAMTGLGIAGIAAGFASGFWTVGGAVNAMLAITNLLMLVVPMLTVWMSINFVLGSILSYYVPLIPFFLFAFGSITWFAVVLEAILAAPLVALGITHPEGHDFLGKAEQSIMLLASVFLRPMLMVFGFIFGIILSYVALSVFNHGFSIAVQFLKDYNGDIFAIVYQTAMMAIYAAAVLAIVNRSFAMIYEVPNKVLRWIGGPQESGHEESMLQGIRGQHDRDVGQIAQQMPTSQGINESSAGGMQLGRRLREMKQTKADVSSSDPNAGGGGAATP